MPLSHQRYNCGVHVVAHGRVETVFESNDVIKCTRLAERISSLEGVHSTHVTMLRVISYEYQNGKRRCRNWREWVIEKVKECLSLKPYQYSPSKIG